MKNKNIFIKILAVVGTILVWFPVLAPLLFSVVAYINGRIFRFDYLMPAELFPVVLVGSLLLLWAALRAHSHRRLIGWGIGIVFISLFGGQALAVVTGLASGANEPVGWRWGLVLASIILYSLAVVAIGIMGVSLLRVLFHSADRDGISKIHH